MEVENKITLFIMTSKGYTILQHIINVFGAEVIDQVITARDKNLVNDYYNEIIACCAKNSITVHDRKVNSEVTTKYSFAISWRWLISLYPENKLIVFHDSILPRYRGFAPLVNALINGETKIGVTALFASEEFDRGDIIDQSVSVVSYPIRIKEAIELNNENYLKLVTSILERIIAKEILVAAPQNEAKATYSLWRDEEDYRINWNDNNCNIIRFINAVGFPYKGASTILNDKIVRVLKAEFVPDVVVENRNAGKVIFIERDCPVVVCGVGLLKITELLDEKGLDLLPLRSFRSRFH